MARELDLPIIAVNLNGERKQDDDLVPPIIRDEAVVHVSFNMAIIKHALDNWPRKFHSLGAQEKKASAWFYEDKVYNDMGL